MQSLFISHFRCKIWNDSKAVVDLDLSCDSLGISEMPKHENSQQQKIGDKRRGEKIKQNKLNQ